MKTSMLGERQRRALVSEWPSVIVRGVPDEGGVPLYLGDLVRLPLCLRHGSGPDVDAVGMVMGFAVGKDGSPSVVVDAPAWNGRRVDSWHTWLVSGCFCNGVEEDEAQRLWHRLERKGHTPAGVLTADAGTRYLVSNSWPLLMAAGVRTKGGVVIAPGDLVRLPRNVARNRGSQLHAAGLCLGYAVGLDGSPCVVADAVGEDVPTLTRWRTWVVRGREVVVIDTKEAWRLEGMYARDGRMKVKRTASTR